MLEMVDEFEYLGPLLCKHLNMEDDIEKERKEEKWQDPYGI